MDHNTLPAPQFELPEPQTKPAKEKLAPLEGDHDIPQQTERSNTEKPAGPAPVSPAQAAQSVAAVPQAATPLIPGSTAAQQAALVNDLTADDGDLIEKSWVQKAKKIVEETRNDPYRQNAEINKVKKDYIKKRYHKDIKLTDE